MLIEMKIGIGMNSLIEKTCKACEGDTLPLNASDIKKLLTEIPGWQLDLIGSEYIEREFEFKNFYQAMAFVNAVAWLAHRENHHPDMEVTYNRCKVRYSTHAINGLSENDFICAAKVNALF